MSSMFTIFLTGLRVGCCHTCLLSKLRIAFDLCCTREIVIRVRMWTFIPSSHNAKFAILISSMMLPSRVLSSVYEFVSCLRCRFVLMSCSYPLLVLIRIILD